MNKKNKVEQTVELFYFSIAIICILNLVILNYCFAGNSELKVYPINKIVMRTQGGEYLREIKNIKEDLKATILKQPVITQEKAIEIAVKEYSSIISKNDIESISTEIFVADMKNIGDYEIECIFRLVFIILCCKKNAFIRIDAITGESLGVWQCHTVPVTKE